uniref:Chromosome partition protein Smc n=1 Tax=Muribaculaceae bacterium Z82 TaxID=2304548 RepID=A0A7C9JN33_9BACT
MYLKSLVLKGFKSFADRSALALEPGITAVVGPNGSGKSNISDAVLWVLGERNAKNLRGQAMEDVIFAGSSSRKSVSVAEVELVLDNTDGTLPVDYSEVSLTRRMYRTGESEYLINGVVARRLDVLDILHDSGLGTGTHSIISQGALDSVLQSKPEDRRALIEEAAGILKHKQRKEKSARKVAQMDAHLDRVKDVVDEVGRQLGPLERKAKRARAYEALSDELASVELSLAVDDLRTLQFAWTEASRRESELQAAVEERKAAIALADARVEQLQEQMQSDAKGAGDIARDLREALSLSQKIDNASLLVRERRRSAMDAVESLEVSLEANKEKAARAREEHETAVESLSGIVKERDAAAAKVREVLARQQENAQARRRLEREADEARDERRSLERSVAADRQLLERTQEELANNLAHMKLVEGRSRELSSGLQAAQDDVARAEEEHRRILASCEELATRESSMRARVAEAVLARDQARESLDRAHESVSVLASKIKGLEELERAASQSSPSLAWLTGPESDFGGALTPLSRGIDVPAELSSLVEALMGESVNLLFTQDGRDSALAVEALVSHGADGYVALASRGAGGSDVSAPGRAAAKQAALDGWGSVLVDRIACESDMRLLVEGAIGDVVLCPSAADAAKAHDECPLPARFCCPEGVVYRPDGVVERYGSVACDDDGTGGVLARAGQLREAKDELSRASEREDLSRTALESAEESLRSLQVESLAVSQQLAQVKGQVSAAEQLLSQTRDKLSSQQRELEDIEAQRAMARKSVDAAQPTVDELKESLAKQTARAAELSLLLDRNEDAAVPLRKAAAALRDEMSEAKLSQARLDERVSYLERMVTARLNDVERLGEEDRSSRRSLAEKAVVMRRAEPLLQQLEFIAQAARGCVARLESQSTQAQEASSGLYSAVTEARAAAKSAHDAYDEDSGRLSESRVEKGRLEVRLDAVMNAVVHAHGMPLDEALGLPPLTDRDEAEEQAARLRRRIGSMGAINPDAAREYEALKARYDFLQSQMDDLAQARRSLAKIVRIIDDRMRSDFLRTFEEVNGYFGEIFAQLFPGGKAELSLVDPDDVENSGVEVSAQPRGKRVAKMSLLSGGEKSLTALALLFAVYRTRSTPFYILDEVEAALDDSNLRRLTAYLEHLRQTTQLIMITHQRRTMEMADVLFGVSMHADGVTKVISQKLDRALQYAE